MAAPLSEDLRKRLVGEVEQGSSARQAAARFAVSASAAISASSHTPALQTLLDHPSPRRQRIAGGRHVDRGRRFCLRLAE